MALERAVCLWEPTAALHHASAALHCASALHRASALHCAAALHHASADLLHLRCLLQRIWVFLLTYARHGDSPAMGRVFSCICLILPFE